MTPHCDPIIPYWHVPKEQGSSGRDALLSLDSYFWFPRLVDKAAQLTGGLGHLVKDYLAVSFWNFALEHEQFDMTHSCEILCATIEALEKEKKHENVITSA